MYKYIKLLIMGTEKKRKSKKKKQIIHKDELREKSLNNDNNQGQGDGAVIPNKGF